MRRGFTLIELLMVITIIAVLAGLLLPAVSTLRTLAKQTGCISNQRQCLIAITAYTGDWDGLTPPAEGNGALALPPFMFPSRNWYTTLFREDFLPAGSVSTYDTSSVALMASLRWPNIASCTVFKPNTNPSGAYGATNFGVRWDFTVPFRPWGSVPLDLLTPDKPFLADTRITTSFWNRASAYWSPTIFPTNAVHLIHGRRRAVLAYPDGRAGARDAAQLASEGVLMTYVPL